MSANSHAALAAATAATAFSRHFFLGADGAVQDYVAQTLLSAAEDGDSVSDQAGLLAEFLPRSTTPEALAEGLGQLEIVFQQLEQQHPFGWLHPPPPPASAASAAAGSPPDTVSTVSASGQLPSSALAEPGPAAKHQPQPPAASSLRVAAAEFRPGAAAGSLAAGLGALQLSREASGDNVGNSCSWAWCGGQEEGVEGASTWGEEGSYWYGGTSAVAEDFAEHYSVQGSWQHAEWQQQEEGDEHLQGLAAGGADAQAAFLAVLAEQFPLFSQAALQQLFEEQRGSLSATIHTLCSLESEIEGQQHAYGVAAYAAEPSIQDVASSQAAPSFTEDEFPTLGGSSRSGAATQLVAGAAATARPGAAGGQDSLYASRARRAAPGPPTTEPQPWSTNSRKPAAGRAAAASSSAAPAPIWKQAEGVQQFATGAAVAQEYAQLRADARDHARLRNAYFQQATQAYLAGDRRLAKELGAKGRWHGEQMAAAHQSAASQLFARRNPGAGSTAAAGGGGGSSGVQTVDLHGLHVSEALQQLETLLFKLQGASSKHRPCLRVVVGTGTHSKVPARLPAAVRRYLQDQGLAFTEPYAGMLEISL